MACRSVDTTIYAASDTFKSINRNHPLGGNEGEEKIAIFVGIIKSNCLIKHNPTDNDTSAISQQAFQIYYHRPLCCCFNRGFGTYAGIGRAMGMDF